MDRIVFIVCEAGCNGYRNKTPPSTSRGKHDQKSILIAHGLDKHCAARSTSWWHIDWFDIFADCRCRMVFTMTTQPNALRLAELIDWPSVKHGSEAAAELRRLHEENKRCRQVCAATAAGWREETKELLEALKAALETMEKDWRHIDLEGPVMSAFGDLEGAVANSHPSTDTIRKSRAVIAKQGEKA
jgi:hypothetical protein